MFGASMGFPYLQLLRDFLEFRVRIATVLRCFSFCSRLELEL